MSHAWNCYKALTFCSLLARCRIPCAYRAKNNILTSKSGPRRSVLTLLPWKRASRHNGAHFFDISTSNSIQKCSGHVGLSTFWLRNVLRATTTCTFSTSQLPISFFCCSGVEVLRTFWIQNLLCAPTACIFLTSQHPKALQCWGVY